MLISRTGQYAIQALVYIGLQGAGSLTNVLDLARNLDVPAAYLAKVLQELGRHGLVNSIRGRSGGFGLGIAADKISLLRVLSLVEGEKFHHECLLGLKECGDDTACPMHGAWKPIKTEILDVLEEQSIATLALAVSQGKYRLTDIPA